MEAYRDAGLRGTILFAIWGVVSVYQKEQSSKTLRLQAEAQLQDLQKRETALKARITSLETERGQEEALREAYGVGKAGEGMVQIVEKQATSTEENTTEHKNWFQRIFWWW